MGRDQSHHTPGHCDLMRGPGVNSEASGDHSDTRQWRKSIIFIQHNSWRVLLVTILHTCNNPDTGQLVSDWAGGQTCDPGALLLGPGGGSWALTPAPGVPWSPVPGPCAPSARSPVARDHRAGAIFTALARTGSQQPSAQIWFPGKCLPARFFVRLTQTEQELRKILPS